MSIITEVKYFLKKKSFIIPLVVVLLLSFGFAITHIAQGIDDLCRARYVENGTYIGYNRLFGWLVMVLLGPNGHETPLQAAIGVLFLGLGAILACVLFRRASRDQLPLACYTVFACLFVSCPLNMAIWVYGDTGFMVKLSYALVPLSLLCLDRFFSCKKTIPLLLSLILVMLPIGMFESAAAVFVFYVGAYLTLGEFYEPSAREGTIKLRLPNLLYRGLVCAGILLFAIVLNSLLTRSVIALFSIPKINQITQSVGWTSGRFTFWGNVVHLIEKILVHHVIAGFFYLPLGLILLGWLISLSLFGLALYKKKPLAFLSVLVMCLSPLLIMVARANFSNYRTCQAAAPFIAFMLTVPAFAALRLKKKPWIGHASIALLLCFSLLQAYSMDQLFRADYVRYQAEVEVIEDVYAQLKSTSAFLGKPVCFLDTQHTSPLRHSDIVKHMPQPKFLGYSEIDRSHWLYNKLHGRIHFLPSEILLQELPTPSIGWACRAFGEYFHFLDYLELSGLTPVSRDTYKTAKDYFWDSDLPIYPDPGYILETTDYIVIRLG